MKQKYKFLFKRVLYYFHGEKFFKRLNYDWKNLPSRTEIIQNIINKKNYEKYLEIGCDKDDNFSKIQAKIKIGVDPQRGGTTRMTSDEFFKNNNENFDIIFLDGLHTYEQTIKDIQNSLNTISNEGTILIHDCLPRKIWYQTPNRMSFTWNGDVWKALVEFRTKPNLDVYTILADEGIGVILKRKNNNLLKISTSNFQKLKFKDYFYNHSEFMNIIKHEDLNKIINNES